MYHMYMLDLRKVFGFEWDEGNIEKSYEKHGVSMRESEELFTDEDVLFIEDVKHSQEEKRFIAIGKIAEGTVLFCAFTVRGNTIRIISSRKANKRERRQYEKT